MIDFHCHILPQIDDGSRNIEETYDMLQEAQKAGFTAIIVTPHYISDTYNTPKSQIQEIINALQQNEGVFLKIYIGSEAYVDPNLDEFIKNNLLSTMCNSKYILFELPMNLPITFLDEVIYSLQNSGLIPVIAHPERYLYVQNNPNMLIDLIQRGVLFQSNYGSILGLYGSKAKKTVKKLLKNNFIHFLGTDTHRHHDIYTNMDNILKDLKKIIDSDKINLLSEINPMHVINNEDIEVLEPIKIKNLGGF